MQSSNNWITLGAGNIIKIHWIHNVAAAARVPNTDYTRNSKFTFLKIIQ